MALPYAYSDWVKMGQFVQLDDGKVFYVHMGEGFPVIMTHAYGGNSWSFSRVLDTFVKHFSVHAMDMPGCAQSETPMLPYGPPEYADSLTEFMDKLGIEKAHLVGNHGSTINAVHFATIRPSRVAKLVIDGAPPWNEQEAKKFWQERFLSQFLDENETPKPYEQSTKFPFPDLEEGDRKAAVQVASQNVKEHGKWWVASMKELVKYPIHPRLHLVEAPTLVSAGDRDWVSHAELGYGSSETTFLNGIAGSRLAIIPNAGGSPAFDQPEAWSKVVLKFLMGD